jgi:hypothetical protein
VSSSREGERVTIACALADIVFDWRLERLSQVGTRIAVHVEVPDAYTLDLNGQKAVIGMSLRQLADVAAGDRTPIAYTTRLSNSTLRSATATIRHRRSPVAAGPSA